MKCGFSVTVWLLLLNLSLSLSVSVRADTSCANDLKQVQHRIAKYNKESKYDQVVTEAASFLKNCGTQIETSEFLSLESDLALASFKNGDAASCLHVIKSIQAFPSYAKADKSLRSSIERNKAKCLKKFTERKGDKAALMYKDQRVHPGCIRALAPWPNGDMISARVNLDAPLGSGSHGCMDNHRYPQIPEDYMGFYAIRMSTDSDNPEIFGYKDLGELRHGLHVIEIRDFSTPTAETPPSTSPAPASVPTASLMRLLVLRFQTMPLFQFDSNGHKEVFHANQLETVGQIELPATKYEKKLNQYLDEIQKELKAQRSNI